MDLLLFSGLGENARCLSCISIGLVSFITQWSSSSRYYKLTDRVPVIPVLLSKRRSEAERERDKNLMCCAIGVEDQLLYNQSTPTSRPGERKHVFFSPGENLHTHKKKSCFDVRIHSNSCR